MIVSKAAFAALALTLGAVAQAQEYPAPLDQALTEAEGRKDARFSYTMTFEWPGAEAVAERFDAATRDWTVVSGDPDALPDAAREKLDNIKDSESVPGGLLYADFRKHLTAIELHEETSEQIVYNFLPPQVVGQVDDTGNAPVVARLYVDKDQPTLDRYEIRGLKPFKPNPAAKMERFVVVQEFERLGADGPAVLVRMVSEQKGKQFFRNVDTNFTATFTDYEPVE